MHFLIVILKTMKPVIIDAVLCISNGETTGNDSFGDDIETILFPMFWFNRFYFQRMGLFHSSSMMMSKTMG